MFENSYTRKPEIVFVTPHYDGIAMAMVDSFNYGLGVAFIRAYLSEKNITTAQYLQYRPRTLLQTAEEIIAMGSSIIGFSCLDTSLYYCLIIAKTIKKIKPDITVVFGGPSVTLADEIIMKWDETVDICCRGEGEEATYEMLTAIKDGKSLKGIPGLSFRENGKIIRNQDRMLPRKGEKSSELDFLPSPYLTGMIPSRLPDGSNIYDSKQKVILTARGCTHKCTYCTNTALSRNKIRYHSVDRVLSEVKHFAETMLPHQEIIFADDAFTLNIERGKEICRRIIDEKLNHIKFSCLTRIDKCDDELWDLFIQAGFKTVAFGLESATPRILNTIKKVHSKPSDKGTFATEKKFLETMKMNIEKAKQIGLETGISIILGLPGETREDADEILRFVGDLKVDYYMHNYLTVVHGTEVGETYRQLGLKVTPSPFILPYRCEYAYNIFDVEPLPNAVNFHHYRMRNKFSVEQLLNFMGVLPRVLPSDTTETGTSIMLDIMPDKAPENLYEWLAAIAQFSSELYIVENDWSYDTNEAKLQIFSKSHVPRDNYLMMKREEIEPGDKNKNKTLVYHLRNLMKMELVSEEYTYSGGSDFKSTIIPYGGIEESEAPGENAVNIARIENNDDLMSMLNLSSKDTGSVTLTPEEFAKLDYAILDRCRWDCRNCPASIEDSSVLKKLIVTDDRNVITCYTGSPVGTVGDSITEITENFKNLQQQAKERRGCDNCPVKNTCSKCPCVPSYLTEAQYCELMKKHADIDIRMEVPLVVHQLRMTHEQELNDAEYLQINWGERESIIENFLPPEKHDVNSVMGRLIKLKTDKKQFLCFTGKWIFSNLSNTMGEIWDLAASGIRGKENICGMVAEKHKASYRAAENAFNMFCKKVMELVDYEPI